MCVVVLCDPNEYLSAPSICFVCVFVCRKIHLKILPLVIVLNEI